MYGADLPGGVRHREGGERAAARPVDPRAIGRRRRLRAVDVLRDDGQRLLERVRRRAHRRRASLQDGQRSHLQFGLLTARSARERRGIYPYTWPFYRVM